MKTDQGTLFILSAPSGAGKTTLCNALLARFPDIRFSVSYTTRPPRPTERGGMDYCFITKEAFVRGIENGRWAEWAEVHGNFYGTSAEFLDSSLAAGHSVLLDIDVQGTLQILRRHPESVTIFIMPPSPEVLMRRLELRGMDADDVIETRLLNAKKEMAEKDRYRHVIVNDQLNEAIENLISTVERYIR